MSQQGDNQELGNVNDNFENNLADNPIVPPNPVNPVMPPNPVNPPPLPHIPLVHNLPDALRLIRKYNGRTEVNEWLTQFQTDLLAFGINLKYACLSLDRFFVDDASNWWSSVSHNFSISADKTEVEFQAIWAKVVTELKIFFDHSALRQVHKAENKQISFHVGDDPQQYVTRKLAILKQIDKSMSDDRKVEQLLKGLPVSIRLQFSSQDIQSISQFLSRLRKYSQILSESKAVESHSQKSSFNSRSSPYSSTTPALHALQQATPAPLEQKACFLCGEVGHFKRFCPLTKQRTPRTQHSNTQYIPPLMNLHVQPRVPRHNAPNFNNFFQQRGQFRQSSPFNSNYRPPLQYDYPPRMHFAYPQYNPRAAPIYQTRNTRYLPNNANMLQISDVNEPQIPQINEPSGN